MRFIVGMFTSLRAIRPFSCLIVLGVVGGSKRRNRCSRKIDCEQYLDHSWLGDTHQLKRGHGRTANLLVTAGRTPAAASAPSGYLHNRKEKEDFHAVVKMEQAAKSHVDRVNS